MPKYDANEDVISPQEIATDCDLPMATVHLWLGQKAAPDPTISKGRFKLWRRREIIPYIEARKKSKGRAA